MSDLPPVRDLPPYRQARIRAVLQETVDRPRPLRRLAPVLVAAVAGLALVTTLAAWQRSGTEGAGTEGIGLGSAPVATGELPHHGAKLDLDPGRIAEIEAGCAQSANLSGKVRLYHYLEDRYGKIAVLYNSKEGVACALDEPGKPPFHSLLVLGGDMNVLPGVISRDTMLAWTSAAGHINVTIGRVAADVAKVRFRHGGQESLITPLNGVYLIRSVEPGDSTSSKIEALSADGAVIGDADCGFPVLDSNGVTGPGIGDCPPKGPWR
ncbi:hypothetical protein GCM10022243_53020 [Saccharothrix violaceirubra]|uniref:Uncharacterized protein n=1 Tax=Saccharothrix violaceirubra TaxID=413306 RepID=A0A7W7WTQ6_9PSEU|nr:hypothetical protein [Saccharothrix violaceirubra]MBB4963364.1 hypothetical protein [Saccharothrix violaceirubra]